MEVVRRMESNKKKIIAGAGLLGVAAVAYMVSRKEPTPPPPQTYKCPYCDETFATYAELLTHIQAEHGQPPPPNMGCVTGHIANKITGAKIANATIYLDSALDCHSDTNGFYATSYVGYGSHTLLVTADNYVQQELQAEVDSQTETLDIQLDPVPVTPPGADWPEDMSVEQITLTPAAVYPGQEVEIEIQTKYCPGPLGFDITGRCHIDGVTLEETFRLDYYNPWYYFHYTPQFPGLYTISSGSSSATLTVLKEEHATYYSPFGGVKWPLVTDIVFPDVAPFTIEYGGSLDVPLKEYPWVFPGGDLKYSEIVDHAYPGYWTNWMIEERHNKGFTWFPVYSPFGSILSNQLANARPAATDITGCPLDKFAMILETWGGPISYDMFPVIMIMITDKQNCGDYWESKEALAQMIGRDHPDVCCPHLYWTNPPAEWIRQYGNLCTTCSGSGRVTDEWGRVVVCPTCIGAGWTWFIDIYKGIKDWIDYAHFPRVYETPESYRGHRYYTIDCPYCGAFTTGLIETTYGWNEPEKTAWARQFLAHIEQSHPTHPLTEPASF
jgi:hypothetical protein